MKAPVGDAERAAAWRYVAEVAGCSQDSVASVDRFHEGNRHVVYKVTFRDTAVSMRTVVVRVSQSGDAAERAQAEREAKVLQLVGGVAGPMLYDFRVESPWFDAPSMCMQFVPGQPRELVSVDYADLHRLGSVLSRLHALPTAALGGETVGGIAAYAQERLRSITGGLGWAHDPLPADIQQRLHKAATTLERDWQPRLVRAFDGGDPLTLLHGDPGTGNILWGAEPVLIDWEYARVGDPADEIAYLFDQNGLTGSQRDAFWRGYREHGENCDRVAARVEWWTPVTLLGSALWWTVRWVRRAESDEGGRTDPGVPRRQEYYRDHVIRRLDRLEAHLAR